MFDVETDLKHKSQFNCQPSSEIMSFLSIFNIHVKNNFRTNYFTGNFFNEGGSTGIGIGQEDVRQLTLLKFRQVRQLEENKL